MIELTLYHGDCLEIMKQLDDSSIDLIICDLPYGCLSTGFRGKEPIARFINGEQQSSTITTQGCAWDVKINLEEFWKEIKRIRRSDHTPTIHFCTTKFGYELIQSNPAEFRYDLVWNKQRGVSFLAANKMPMRSHEMMYVFSKAGAWYHRIDEDGKKACALSVINIKKAGFKQHPTQKPEEMYRWLIERYCPAGGTVLDPTFGSGNSVFTAYSMGYNAIGIEKDETFFDKAVARLPQ